MAQPYGIPRAPQDSIGEFLSWCAQFRDFPYAEMQYWRAAYDRGDGTDMYGRPMQTLSDRVLRKRR